MDRKLAIAREIPRLRRYARALVRDPAEADDLVQDCLARALAGLRHWRLGDDPRKWLFTIMHNLNVDRLRALGRAPVVTDIESLPGDRLSVPADQADGLHLRNVLDALHALPDERRQALVLVAIEGMSYRDAASVLDIPLGTLMSRLARGRQHLRQILDTRPGTAGHLRSVP